MFTELEIGKVRGKSAVEMSVVGIETGNGLARIGRTTLL